MKRFVPTFILLAVLTSLFLPQNASAGDATEKKPPRTVVPADFVAYKGDHIKNCARIARGNVDLLIVGDTMFWKWRQNAFAPYLFYFGDRRHVPMALDWNRIQNVLWCLNNAPMDKIQPKVAMVQMGYHNLVCHPYDTPEDVALGIQACVDKLQALYPNIKILVMDVFVAGEPNDPMRQKITATNAKMRELLRNYKNVKIMDVNDLWLNEKGEIRKELIGPVGNNYHPSYQGYLLLGKRVEPVIAEMLGVKAKELKN